MSQMDYTPLAGGLDLAASPMQIAAGRCLTAENIEQVYGLSGYRRVDGYERFDGRLLASTARYYIATACNMTAPLSVGDIATTPSGSAEIMAIEGDVLVLVNVSGSLTAGQTLSVLAEARATLATDAAAGTFDSPDYRARRRAAVAYLRAKIGKVPGSGPVRGVAVFNAQVFALRDNAEGTAAALYRSSLTGWQLVCDLFRPGGSLQAVVANFVGATAGRAWYGCDGVNPPFKCDGSTVTFMAPIMGSEATASNAVTPAAGDLTFTVVETSRSWAVGDELEAWAPAAPASWLKGKVKSYSGATLVLTVAEFAGTASSAWRIARADRSDRPRRVSEFKNHLFLAYPNGQLQHSNLGDPMLYTTTAGLLGVSDEITGMASLKGDVFAVFCRGRIVFLTGASKSDWQLATHSQDIGARANSAVETAGNALFLDSRGLTSLAATQSFGGFSAALLSHAAQPLIDAATTSAIAARAVKRKNQYRIYLPGGMGITAAVWRPSPVIEPNSVAFTTFRYEHQFSAFANGDDADGDEFNVFGTKDGWVMLEDSGTSFDGAPIAARIALPFHYLKRPAQKKRFHRMALELQAAEPIELRVRHTFDYDGLRYDPSIVYRVDAQRHGAAWGAAEFGNAIWTGPGEDSPVAHLDGVGTNIGALIWHESDDTPAFTLSGISLYYSLRGEQR